MTLPPEQPSAPRERRLPVPVRASAKDRLLRLAELVVGDWAPTLREAALRTLLFTVVLIVLGIAFGGAVAGVAAAVGVFTFLVGRRRDGAGG